MLLLRASLSQGQRLQPSPSIKTVSPTHEGTFDLLGPDGNPKSCWTSLVGHLKNAKMGIIRWIRRTKLACLSKKQPNRCKMPAERTESGFIEQFRRDPKLANPKSRYALRLPAHGRSTISSKYNLSTAFSFI